jgi:hypothetical protein
MCIFFLTGKAAKELQIKILGKVQIMNFDQFLESVETGLTD